MTSSRSFIARVVHTAACLLLPAVTAAVVAACGNQNTPSEQTAAPAGSDKGTAVATAAGDPVQRGEYLVTVGGCNDCHTPWKMGANGPEPDMTRMLSGHPHDMKMPPISKPADAPWGWNGAATMTAFAGPWGVSYTRNLTPDTLTGIGTWSEDTFVQTLRTGKHMGTGRPLMPPMPWQNLARATDEDLKAIYAYLRTIPPVSNQVPEYEPPTGGVAMAPAGGGNSEGKGM